MVPLFLCFCSKNNLQNAPFPFHFFSIFLYIFFLGIVPQIAAYPGENMGCVYVYGVPSFPFVFILKNAGNLSNNFKIAEGKRLA